MTMKSFWKIAFQKDSKSLKTCSATPVFEVKISLSVSLEISNYLPCESTLESNHQQKAPLPAKPNQAVACASG